MSDKVEVRRANVYLTIDSDAVDRYIAKGFDVVDSQGNVIKKSVPVDINILQKAYTDHEAEIAKLKAENESLKAQLKEKEKASKAPKEKVEEKVEEKPKSEPKTSTTKKTSSKK